tara:strand:+ start:549 stop:800 length:252 start_codon:yes stop_codon:yes gene_type:complete
LATERKQQNERKNMAPKKKATAKKKPAKPRKTHTVSVEITDAAYKKLTKYAKSAGSNVGAMAGKAITAGLKNAKVEKVEKVKW